MDKFERIRRLRDDYESSLDEAERLREEYHRGIVKLHRSGMSLRDIGEGLGISHQRVHQIVSPLEEQPRRKGRRRVAAGGVGAVILFAVSAGLFLTRDSPLTERGPIPSASPRSLTPPLITTACNPHLNSSAFEVITIAADCQRQLGALLRNGHDAVVALDPRTGEVLAIASSSGVGSLREALTGR